MVKQGDEEQLLSFLNAVLAKTECNVLTPIAIIENTKITPDVLGDKSCILDVRAKTADGTKIEIEVQLANEYNMIKRLLYYWSREFVVNLNSGDNYQELPKVIAIGILNFSLLTVPEFHSTYHIWEDNNKKCKLTDDLELHFIDMKKFRKLKNKDIENNPLHRWLSFLNEKESDETIKKVINMDSGIKSADEKMKDLLKDKESLIHYQKREFAITEYNNALLRREEKGIEIGEKRGIEKGIEKGRSEEKLTIAINLKKQGFTPETISKATGIPINEIEDL
ncbi:Rpn family recombination-promoting nuclease/putative transposase [Methanobrevibacter filiformis]|uniref:Rpn family recombination-promoting nuclease/putative transposase n=1 Tax=Methanobrevibacter filiformis TaxID=55758 RepID=UPI0008350387|nr:Rpn family recombination-promoting nuclease/putative transposase [Methanobrevibacter filiformis]